MRYGDRSLFEVKVFDGRIKELNGFKLSINRVKRQSETIFSGNGSTPVIVRIKFAKLCRVSSKGQTYIRVYTCIHICVSSSIVAEAAFNAVNGLLISLTRIWSALDSNYFSLAFGHHREQLVPILFLRFASQTNLIIPQPSFVNFINNFYRLKRKGFPHRGKIFDTVFRIQLDIYRVSRKKGKFNFWWFFSPFSLILGILKSLWTSFLSSF